MDITKVMYWLSMPTVIGSRKLAHIIQHNTFGFGGRSFNSKRNKKHRIRPDWKRWSVNY